MLNKKVKTKKAFHWVIELAIWFLIFIALANVILFIKAKHDKAYNTYQIFMPDVDGVIVGSAVNMMGVPVGYVDRVKIIDNEVFVQFTLNKKGLELPKGAIVTVEFSGLGGSKSLVVYPPNDDTKRGEAYLVVQAPKRLGDAVSLIDDMFDKISSITYRMSYFGNEVSKSKIDSKGKTNNKDMMKGLKEFDKNLDQTQKKLEKLNNNKNKKGE